MRIRFLFIIVLVLCIAACTHHWAPVVGVQLYSLKTELETNADSALQMVEDWGVGYVEVPSVYGYDTAEFAHKLKSRNLTVLSVNADFNQLQNNPETVADFAETFGAEYAVCAWIPHEWEHFSKTDMDTAIAVFSRSGKLLSQRGIQLCFHPHWYEFDTIGKGTLFDYLLENTAAGDLSIELDVFWIKHAGYDPVSFIAKYHRRIPILHLKDRKKGAAGQAGKPADIETNVVAGSGDVGVGGIIKSAEYYGINYLVLEDESSRAAEQLPKSLEYVRRYIDRKY